MHLPLSKRRALSGAGYLQHHSVCSRWTCVLTHVVHRLSHHVSGGGVEDTLDRVGNRHDLVLAIYILT